MHHMVIARHGVAMLRKNRHLTPRPQHQLLLIFSRFSFLHLAVVCVTLVSCLFNTI